MLETLSVSDLARRCREETQRYLRREPYAERYCHELFRRAILSRDEDAWAAVYHQYVGVVRRWLGAAPDDDEDVTAVFERFWKALDSTKFARFGSLSAILQYLKMCAHTTRLDKARAGRAARLEEPLAETTVEARSDDGIEQGMVDRVDAPAFWETIRAHLRSERERRLIYLSYVIGLSPRAICERFKAEFPDVAEVYKLKRAVLDRLRRVRELQNLR